MSLEIMNSLITVLFIYVSIVLHEVSHLIVLAKVDGCSPSSSIFQKLKLAMQQFEYKGAIIAPLVFGILSFAFVGRVYILGWAKPIQGGAILREGKSSRLAIVALAGPVTNLILAALGAILKFYLVTYGVSQSILSVADIWIFVNIALALINLLPFKPFDGGVILDSVFNSKQTYVLRMLFLLLALLFLVNVFSV